MRSSITVEESVGNAEDQQKVSLSHRELECLCLAASGKRASEIASLLSIKKSTVDGYKKQIFKKLGALNMGHAIFKAMSCASLAEKLNQSHFHLKGESK
jgi:DNA-binding CsgD family transcriptional regulator